MSNTGSVAPGGDDPEPPAAGSSQRETGCGPSPDADRVWRRPNMRVSWIKAIPRGNGEPLLIGHHFSKTGGTSLIRHAQNMLGLRGFYTFGQDTNDQRLRNGQPLLMDLPRPRIDDIKILTGHGLIQQAINRFIGRDARLFTIIRDPFDRFASVYKHRLRTMPQEQWPTPEELFEQQRANPWSHELRRRFCKPESGPLPTGANGPDAQLVKALGRFDMILTTEHLDDQNEHLFAHIGLPGTRERARVYPETPDLGSVTREMVYERDGVDLAIHRRATRAWLANRSVNPYRLHATVEAG